jgi:hypothetical protein
MIYLYIEAGLFVLLLITAPGQLYADFAAVMNFKRVRDTVGLTRLQTVCGSYILARGYLLDLFVNVFHVSLILGELPRELTVTRRLRRHIEGDTKHAALCLRFRQEIDALDPSGIHR